MTEHEDVEIGRCIWNHIHKNCTTSYETSSLFFQNWRRDALPGEIGYKNNIDAEKDLKIKTLDNAISLHAIKQPESQKAVRIKILKRRIQKMIGKTALLRPRDSGNLVDKGLNDCVWHEVRNLNNEHAPAIYQNAPNPGSKLHKPWPEILRKTDTFIPGTQLHSTLYKCVNSKGISILRPGMDDFGWKLSLTHARFSDFFMRENGEIGQDQSKYRKLTLIVPLYKRQSAFIRFIKNYAKLLESLPNLHLVVAISGDEIERQNIAEIMEENISENFLHSNARMNSCKVPFDKAHCLQVAIDALEEQDLFFVYDVDILVTKNFIKRVLALGNDFVYFPTLFSQYELTNHEDFKISESNGFWRSHGVGPVAMTKRTYLSSDGYNQNIHGWGNEDTELYDDFIKRGIKFVRSHDEGIFHPWHSKNCTGLSNETGQFQACVKINKEHTCGQTALAQKYLSQLKFFNKMRL
ncbi:Oidioi.mRNA.OKI2018_I69.chr1.g417.t1.cds [Oikopleura dioica]|uniref:Hexosyltransferase n=1 Tax=Oikopleura dioica TaxID=34765 RepID=A0ABN7SJT5_OIKDI|nr:Oidioi.mRNA.OKI2018_I69.chr1.g417.t1.cds [Oikopleura dioica]